MEKEVAQEHFDAFSVWTWDTKFNKTNEENAQFFIERDVTQAEVVEAVGKYRLMPTVTLKELQSR